MSTPILIRPVAIAELEYVQALAASTTTQCFEEHELANVASAIAGLLVLSTTSPAIAWDDVFAKCGPFKGYTIGVGGSEEKHKALDFSDEMSGEYQLLYKGGDREARIIGPGRSPTIEEGIVIKRSDEQLSMVVVYPVSVFLYTLFPERRKLIITKHTHSRGVEFDAARGFMMVGNCSSLDVYAKPAKGHRPKLRLTEEDFIEDPAAMAKVPKVPGGR